ncbi:Bro-N domain-containing protein [Pseudomonas granadensis]|uniref:BRO-N domain-containing protein n=1 Tax=Pseudomonas granadensis TaxID=1421430 RepID=UPI00300EFAED
MSEPLLPTRFTRNKTHLHALLVENQAWFCVHELGRLMGKHLDERQLRKLDADQRQLMCVELFGEIEEQWMVSESGVYALLIYHYCPEYRQLREWVTLQVVPALRDARPLRFVERPVLSILNWPHMSLRMLHWQDEPWIRLRDMPCVLSHDPFIGRRYYWKKALQILDRLF